MKKIGITTKFIKNTDYSIPVVGLSDSYAKSIREVGGLPIYIPIEDLSVLSEKEKSGLLTEWSNLIDGLILSGGEDINPTFYNQSAHEKLQEISAIRDRFEIDLFNKVLPTNKKILGVCRGHQLINVAMGGTLIQDIPSIKPSLIAHSSNEDKWFTKGHAINIQPNTKLYKMFNQSYTHVNTIHHQAIDRIAEDLEVSASADDGIIEACESKKYINLLSVQWHPETMWQSLSEISADEKENNLKLFKWLVDL